MDQDITEIPVTETEPENEIEFYEDAGPSDSEWMHALCVAFDTACEINPLTKAETARIDRIKFRVVKLLDHFIGKKYDEIFQPKTAEEE
jgi:hypothetical protein